MGLLGELVGDAVQAKQCEDGEDELSPSHMHDFQISPFPPHTAPSLRGAPLPAHARRVPRSPSLPPGGGGTSGAALPARPLRGRCGRCAPAAVPALSPARPGLPFPGTASCNAVTTPPAACRGDKAPVAARLSRAGRPVVEERAEPSSGRSRRRPV